MFDTADEWTIESIWSNSMTLSLSLELLLFHPHPLAPQYINTFNQYFLNTPLIYDEVKTKASYA
jgi:hypothetical protein